MKFGFLALLLGLSLQAQASEVCTSADMADAALKHGKWMGYREGLTYVRENVEAEIEYMELDRQGLRTYRVKASFSSTEEHEFIRVSVTVDDQCRVTQALILQDSRH